MEYHSTEYEDSLTSGRNTRSSDRSSPSSEHKTIDLRLRPTGDSPTFNQKSHRTDDIISAAGVNKEFNVSHKSKVPNYGLALRENQLLGEQEEEQRVRRKSLPDLQENKISFRDQSRWPNQENSKPHLEQVVDGPFKFKQKEITPNKFGYNLLISRNNNSDYIDPELGINPIRVHRKATSHQSKASWDPSSLERKFFKHADQDSRPTVPFENRTRHHRISLNGGHLLGGLDLDSGDGSDGSNLRETQRTSRPLGTRDWRKKEFAGQGAASSFDTGTCSSDSTTDEQLRQRTRRRSSLPNIHEQNGQRKPVLRHQTYNQKDINESVGKFQERLPNLQLYDSFNDISNKKRNTDSNERNSRNKDHFYRHLNQNSRYPNIPNRDQKRPNIGKHPHENPEQGSYNLKPPNSQQQNRSRNINRRSSENSQQNYSDFNNKNNKRTDPLFHAHSTDDLANTKLTKKDQEFDGSVGRNSSNRGMNSITDNVYGKLVTFYRNGDENFTGFKTSVSARAFGKFDCLLNWLNQKIPISGGIRHVFAIPGGKKITNLKEFQTGESYVVSNAPRLRRVNYGDSRERIWRSFVSPNEEKNSSDPYLPPVKEKRKSRSYPGDVSPFLGLNENWRRGSNGKGTYQQKHILRLRQRETEQQKETQEQQLRKQLEAEREQKQLLKQQQNQLLQQQQKQQQLLQQQVQEQQLQQQRQQQQLQQQKQQLQQQQLDHKNQQLLQQQKLLRQQLQNMPATSRLAAGDRARVLLIRSNTDRSSQLKLLIDLKTFTSFEELLRALTDSLRLDNPPVKALFTATPPYRKVTGLSHLIHTLRNQQEFLACGEELIPRELQPLSESSPTSDFNNPSHYAKYSPDGQTHTAGLPPGNRRASRIPLPANRSPTSPHEPHRRTGSEPANLDSMDLPGKGIPVSSRPTEYNKSKVVAEKMEPMDSSGLGRKVRESSRNNQNGAKLITAPSLDYSDPDVMELVYYGYVAPGGVSGKAGGVFQGDPGGNSSRKHRDSLENSHAHQMPEINTLNNRARKDKWVNGGHDVDMI